MQARKGGHIYRGHLCWGRSSLEGKGSYRVGQNMEKMSVEAAMSKLTGYIQLQLSDENKEMDQAYDVIKAYIEQEVIDRIKKAPEY
jgi:hypothetical protein